MYSIKIDGSDNISAEISVSGNVFSATLNGKKREGNWSRLNSRQLHVLSDNGSFTVDVLRINREDKTLTLGINGHRFSVQLKDKYDELLSKLGMDSLAAKKLSDIKAPMPGMVLNVLVNEGSAVKKGDALLVLEAMKMENILKSPSDGVVKKVIASKGKAVEKNEVLIQF